MLDIDNTIKRSEKMSETKKEITEKAIKELIELGVIVDRGDGMMKLTPFGWEVGEAMFGEAPPKELVTKHKE